MNIITPAATCAQLRGLSHIMKDECQIVFHKKTNTSVFVYEDQSQQKFISITKVAIAKRLKFPTIRVVWFCCFDLDQASTHVWPSFLQQCNVQWAQNQLHFFFATLFFVHWTHNQASATSFLLCNFIFALKLYFCFATLFNYASKKQERLVFAFFINAKLMYKNVQRCVKFMFISFH